MERSFLHIQRQHRSLRKLPPTSRTSQVLRACSQLPHRTERHNCRTQPAHRDPLSPAHLVQALRHPAAPCIQWPGGPCAASSPHLRSGSCRRKLRSTRPHQYFAITSAIACPIFISSFKSVVPKAIGTNGSPVRGPAETESRLQANVPGCVPVHLPAIPGTARKLMPSARSIVTSPSGVLHCPCDMIASVHRRGWCRTPRIRIFLGISIREKTAAATWPE